MEEPETRVGRADAELREFITGLVLRHKLNTYDLVGILETIKGTMIVVATDAAKKTIQLVHRPGG
ncbi:MAG: hypothetical protein V3V93_04065 [bacterium]